MTLKVLIIINSWVARLYCNLDNEYIFRVIRPRGGGGGGVLTPNFGGYVRRQSDRISLIICENYMLRYENLGLKMGISRAAHTRYAYIWKYPPPPPRGSEILASK